MSTKKTPKNKNSQKQNSPVIFNISEVFDFNGNYIKIQKTDDESREVYLMRVEYILNNYDPNSKVISRSNIENLVRLSLIWRNSTIYGMIYPTSVTKKIF
jgi:hypothetical protein